MVGRFLCVLIMVTGRDNNRYTSSNKNDNDHDKNDNNLAGML